MSFFDEQDPFDSIVREFFGEGRKTKRERYSGSEEEERVIDFIEGDNAVYVLFELAGYSEDEVQVEIKGKQLTIEAQKESVEGLKEYLAQKLARGISYTRKLPDFISTKKFSKTMHNGILELVFEKRRSE